MHLARLGFQKVAEAEAAFFNSKLLDIRHLVRQADLFFFDLSELASDRVDLVFLATDQSLIDSIHLLQRQTSEKLPGI